MRQFLSTPGFKPTLLAMLVSAGCLPVMAATTNTGTAASGTAAPAGQGEQTLTVTASPESDFKSGGDQLVPAYLDGQIAHGGRLGMLGEQKAMDVPFSVIGFTSKMIQDQQAHTIADVVKNDAGVQSVKGYGNFAESYRIRGFLLDGDDMTYGGLPGVVPRQVMDASLIDRVEIFKGANSLLNGAATGAVGGMINLEPKHADDVPLTRVGVDYTTSSQVGTNVDIGRRFGDNNQFGVRLNAVHREGETGVDDEKKRTTAASIGLDYRGDRLRTSLDVGYQKKRSIMLDWASTSAASILFQPSRPTRITTARNGCTATWNQSLASPKLSTTSPITGQPMRRWARSMPMKPVTTARQKSSTATVMPLSVRLTPTAFRTT